MRCSVRSVSDLLIFAERVDWHTRSLLSAITAQGRTADFSDVSMEAADMINRNPEYEGFEEFTVKDAKGNLVAAGFNTTEYMLDKITFAGTSKRRLEAVLEETADYYMAHPSFIGFAIHYYTTFKDLPE